MKWVLAESNIKGGTILTVSLFCLLIACLEIPFWTPLSKPESLFLLSYLALLLLAVKKPRLSWTLILLCSIIRSLYPHEINGPEDFWGVWMSIGFLAYDSGTLIAIILTASLMSSFYINHIFNNTTIDSSVVTLSMSYPFILLVSFLFSMKQARERAILHQKDLDEKLKQQHERERLTHILHDNIAGSLSYLILLCRNAEITDQPNSKKIQEIESVLDKTLVVLRKDILEFNTKPCDISSGIGQKITADSFCHLTHQKDLQLSLLGFTGSTQVVNESQYLPAYLEPLYMEITNNIIKHGKPGSYTIRVQINDDQSFTITSGNLCKAESSIPGSQGLLLIRELVSRNKGAFQCNSEDGEWSIMISLPGSTYDRTTTAGTAGNQ